MTDAVITVRRAGEADVPAIAALERACFSEPWSEGALTDTLRSPYAVLFCAVLPDEAGTIASYGGLYLLGEDADITNVATHPAYRRRGAAAAVLEALLDCARAHGVCAVHLEVRRPNAAAAALYRAHGFTVDGTRPRYYKNPSEDAVLMTCRFPGSTEGNQSSCIC